MNRRAVLPLAQHGPLSMRHLYALATRDGGMRAHELVEVLLGETPEADRKSGRYGKTYWIRFVDHVLQRERAAGNLTYKNRLWFWSIKE